MSQKCISVSQTYNAPPTFGRNTIATLAIGRLLPTMPAFQAIICYRARTLAHVRSTLTLFVRYHNYDACLHTTTGITCRCQGVGNNAAVTKSETGLVHKVNSKLCCSCCAIRALQSGQPSVTKDAPLRASIS